MTHRYLLNGRKVSRKAVVEKIGESRLKNMERQADAQFRDDPFVQNDFFCGSFMLSIEFPILDSVNW